MKLQAVLFTTFVAFATVNCHYLPDFGKGPLHEDIQYFLDMIPMEQVISTVLKYAAEDAEFQDFLKYFSTTEFKDMIVDVEAMPEFRKFANYLQNNGVFIYDELNKLNKIIGIPSIHQYNSIEYNNKKITGGVKGLFDDVKALISYDKFIHGYVYKMRTSEAFRDFVAELKSKGNQEFADALYVKQRYLNFRALIIKKGIDFVLIEDIIYVVLGVEFPVIETMEIFASEELSKDLHDFMNLVDKNKILNIITSYLKDDEVQKALKYMYSDEFHDLVRLVEAMPEYQDLVKFLENSGLNMTELINKIHHLFGMEDYVPPKVNIKHLSINTYSNLGGIKALVDAVKAALPLDKFKALYEEKMKTSAAFRTFMERLRSDDFQHIVKTVYSSHIFLEMRQKCIDAGLNLESLRDLIENVLGIHLPRP